METKMRKEPVFSTYDAEGGCIWTRIRKNGNVSVYDDVENNFKIVIQGGES